ncbi:hypothetical protein [Azospirillum thiophilum]|uniref:hypothetical protein n=1 Tax=Azospirillum thiophilum TaxID=528244 RepID=UPI0011875C63|nr:hypothetical protein [Azospirillum thiophilum]
MIKLRMALVPYGEYRLGEHPVITGSIWTTIGNDGQSAHAYRIAIVNPEQDHVIIGEIAKSRSGHRNPLHLLGAIIADIDLPALGTDYAFSQVDMPINEPRLNKKGRYRIADLTAECIDRIRSLAAVGEDGKVALERIEAALTDAKAGVAGPPHGEQGPVTDPDIINAIVSGCGISSKV